ncbi:MAG TPA: hypothetical protein VEJ63_13185 [Planctomycetota bacterium]|nr:hypothetical protein [Planctomycetota bacterium]
MDPDYSHTLYHNDLSALALGSLPFHDGIASQHLSLNLPPLPGGLSIPSIDPEWTLESPPFKVIERGTSKYIEAVGSSPFGSRRFVVAGDPQWRDLRVRAVITPLDPDGSDTVQGVCGIVARFTDAQNFIALVIDRDRQLKLIQHVHGHDTLIDARPLEFCLGQSLTLTLRLSGDQAQGTAGPYSGATHVKGTLPAAATTGRVGYVTRMPARFGPLTVEATREEASRLEQQSGALAKTRSAAKAKYPKLRLERTLPLHGLVNGRNIRIADINRDGKPEIILAQGSPDLARKLSLTRLTCLTVLNLEGKVLWQAGVPDKNAPLIPGDLPFQVHDVYGDGGKVVVCVFGYDLQVRDGRTGKVLFSAETPKRVWVSDDYKHVTHAFGAKWGDETLNMDVAALGFCSTLGNGSREIFVQDDFHSFAVMDAISDPPLQPLFQFRGSHGRYPWVSDVNDDDKQEILAGYCLLSEGGKALSTLLLGGYANAAAIVDPLNSNASQRRVMLAAGAEGFILADLKTLLRSNAPAKKFDPNAVGRVSLPRGTGPHATRLSVAKFRSDLPGLQIAVVSGWNSAGELALYDASGRQLWARSLPPEGVLGQPVNWTGQPEELILASLAPGLGLFNGFGDCVVDAPGSAGYTCFDTTAAFCVDGRDGVIAWNNNELAVFVPDDAPRSSDVYKPQRPGAENASNFRAVVSLPPNWTL